MVVEKEQISFGIVGRENKVVEEPGKGREAVREVNVEMLELVYCVGSESIVGREAI